MTGTRRLDLQAKIILVLIAVIAPTFLIVTFAENKITKPILEDDIRMVGINSAKTLAAEIVSARLVYRKDAGPLIDGRIQELIYSQPNIFRIDVALRDAATGVVRIVASSVEDDPGSPSSTPPFVDAVTSAQRTDENGSAFWEISVPIEIKSRDPRGPRRLVGTVHALISLQLVARLTETLWRTTVTAALFSVVTLIFVLSYFLRKTISNDRKLQRAETENVHLTEQLHETQRQLMNTEKLAVMGQLTASFAHEIGTPLNAIGGHLQLLKEEISEPSPTMAMGGLDATVGVRGAPGAGNAGLGMMVERVDIIGGQVSKIEEIVKGFLQSTAKPSSQRQLVDVNPIVDKTLQIVNPRIESLGVRVERDFDRVMGPIRIVPLDLEQVLLNLVNNSLDSIRGKCAGSGSGAGQEAAFDADGRPLIGIDTKSIKVDGREWARITVYDTGEGIRKTDLSKVFKPFFTTKPPGEGTGLGLAICKQLMHKYGGDLMIDSKEGSWTRVTVMIPYPYSSGA